MKSFEALRRVYAETFTTFAFDLPPDTNISSLVNERIPDVCGIYFVFDVLGCLGLPVYSGRAGTYKESGWSKQKLPGRLKALQGRIPRNQFFRSRINDLALSGISFQCFVTVDDNNDILPHAAEASAMHAFHDDFNRLPQLNNDY